MWALDTASGEVVCLTQRTAAITQDLLNSQNRDLPLSEDLIEGMLVDHLTVSGYVAEPVAPECERWCCCCAGAGVCAGPVYLCRWVCRVTAWPHANHHRASFAGHTRPPPP